MDSNLSALLGKPPLLTPSLTAIFFSWMTAVTPSELSPLNTVPWVLNLNTFEWTWDPITHLLPTLQRSLISFRIKPRSLQHAIKLLTIHSSSSSASYYSHSPFWLPLPPWLWAMMLAPCSSSDMLSTCFRSLFSLGWPWNMLFLDVQTNQPPSN